MNDKQKQYIKYFNRVLDDIDMTNEGFSILDEHGQTLIYVALAENDLDYFVVYIHNRSYAFYDKKDVSAFIKLLLKSEQFPL